MSESEVWSRLGWQETDEIIVFLDSHRESIWNKVKKSSKI